MTYAIFRSGGKQFRAEPGKTLRLPSLSAEAGTTVEFTDILLGTAEGFNEALTANYAPAVISDVIVVAILVPILVAIWEPVKEQLGR